MNSKFIGDSSVHSHDEFLGLEVIKGEGSDGDYNVYFYLSDGRKIEMYHIQDCCEDVRLEEVDTVLSEVKGIIKKFEMTTLDLVDEDGMATFYNIVIGNTSFNMRWYGTSNGHYSVDVDVILTEV